MACRSTEWPAHTVRYAVKQLVELVFQLIEDQADDVGIRLMQEVFVADGLLQASSEKFIGKKGMHIRRLGREIPRLCMKTNLFFKSRNSEFASRSLDWQYRVSEIRSLESLYCMSCGR